MTDWCLQTRITQWRLRLQTWFFHCLTSLQPKIYFLAYCSMYNALFIDLPVSSFVFHSSLLTMKVSILWYTSWLPLCNGNCPYFSYWLLQLEVLFKKRSTVSMKHDGYFTFQMIIDEHGTISLGAQHHSYFLQWLLCLQRCFSNSSWFVRLCNGLMPVKVHNGYFTDDYWYDWGAAPLLQDAWVHQAILLLQKSQQNSKQEYCCSLAIALILSPTSVFTLSSHFTSCISKYYTTSWHSQYFNAPLKRKMYKHVWWGSMSQLLLWKLWSYTGWCWVYNLHLLGSEAFKMYI